MRWPRIARPLYLLIAIALAGCGGDAPNTADYALKEKLTGHWYWSYEWKSRDATVHTLTHRKPNGTWVRHVRTHNGDGTLERSEQSGTWDISGSRYAER